MSIKCDISDGEDRSMSGTVRSPVGRLVESNQADDRKMISLVKQRPLLFARCNMPIASYYSQVKLLWKEVADQMGCGVAEVRRKWSHIRNSYSRHLRNELSGARTVKGRTVSRWYLADELEFLKQHMATDRIKLSSSEPSLIAISDSLSSMTSELLEKSSVYVNLAMPPSSASKNIERRLPAYSWIDPQDHPASSEPFLNHSWYLPPQGSVKLEPEHDDSSNSQSLAPDADENSAYFQFFRSIFHDYKELVPRKQRLFRRQCLNYLHELLDESEEPLDHAINLSNSADTSGLDKCVIMKVEPCDNM